MANTPTETLTEYVRAFESLDPNAFVPYYNLPCMLITPAGITAVADPATRQALATQLVTQARQHGYKRTEFLGPVDCRMLSPTLALLSGVFRRLNSSDQVILDLGFSYLMNKSDEGWKIVVAALY
jgi:hypothetical protein